MTRISLGTHELVHLSCAATPKAHLSRAEREVAAALLAGNTNEEIAKRRDCSVRTVANQVAHVFRKLGVGSRAELAARWTISSLLGETS